MSYPLNYPTPQNANVQVFYSSSQGGTVRSHSWVKPQGASFVWFTLIGSGGPGSSAIPQAGGSGAVTNFMCPAFLIPDELRICVGNQAGSDTTVQYQQKDGAGYTLLLAYGAGGQTGAAAWTGSPFTAMGFYQSIAGQDGSTGSSSASATTFLAGGANSANDEARANYGYLTPTTSLNAPGFFQMQPIIVGLGGKGSGNGGVGCGGGGAGDGKGGPGLCVIITW